MNMPDGRKPARRARNCRFSDLAIHPSVPREPETAFTKPIVEPIATMFTVPSDYNFHDPACKGIDFICWPTVAPPASSTTSPRAQAFPAGIGCCW